MSFLYFRKEMADEFSSAAASDIAAQLQDDPARYINDPNIEIAWVHKTVERANIHMNLLLKCDTQKLTLHSRQQEIYEKFREAFPDMQVEKVGESQLKGATKQKWFEFCEQFKDVEDYNMGTLFRMDAEGVYNEANTIIVPKIIHMAIEITRNKEGVNKKSKEKYTKDLEMAGLGSTGSIFSSAPASTASVGLGGTTIAGLGGNASQAATGARTDKSGVENPLDAFVEDGLQQLFNALKDKIKANQAALDTFALESTTDPLKLEEKLNTVRQNVGELKTQMTSLDRQVTTIADKSKIDRSIANQATMRQNHLTKGTKYGLEQSVHYMDSIVDTYEDTIMNHHESLNNVESFIRSRLAALDSKSEALNVESGLQQHCTRFESLFRRSASKIFENDENMKRIKADFLSVRRRKYGQYTKDPFKSAAPKNVDNKENLPLLKADQTFPSQTTLMRIGQSVPKVAAAPGTTGTGVGFGTTAPFTFNTAATSTVSTAGSLFNKPFGATPTTTTAASSLFGTTTSTATSSAPSAFPFSNTLNSSVSGTLFGGSASKPFGK
ncbi:hypothetical protein QR680_009478 [Steinernema hermaphroditum]|uniref:Polysaccharide biosynthesis domain-containing protein n=1 Tax=Steinernema hermaphroditum TaxID=289476 RepID=A0AA39IKE0_9BILA|nr:hypothetical protein QR680_009478 [Steinernema hermaphroditum]